MVATLFFFIIIFFLSQTDSFMGNFSQITSTDVLVYQLTGAASVKSFCETHTPKHIILLITLSRLILLFYVCVCVCVG